MQYWSAEEEEEKRAEFTLKTGLKNAAEKARLQIVLRQLERSEKTSEFEIRRYQEKLRQDIITFEAQKNAMRSRHCSFSRLDSEFEKDAQKEMIKILSQRGRYFYTLKTQVNIRKDFMTNYNPRFERAKKLLVPAKRASTEAMERGQMLFPPVVEDYYDTLNSGRESSDPRKTPSCLIFPRI